jgi:hypothetical protein
MTQIQHGDGIYDCYIMCILWYKFFTYMGLSIGVLSTYVSFLVRRGTLFYFLQVISEGL